LYVLTPEDDISRNPDTSQTEEEGEHHQVLVAKIRARFKEIESLIEGMKSKLPDKE